MARAVLMVKALVAFLVPGAYTNALADADHALELSRNQPLQAAGSERQQAHHRDTQGAVLGRLHLLRGRVVKSLLFIASAVFAAGAVAWVPSSRPAFADGDPADRISVTFRMGDLGSPRLGRAVVERRHRGRAWTKSYSGLPTGSERSVVYWRSSEAAIRRAVALDRAPAIRSGVDEAR